MNAHRHDPVPPALPGAHDDRSGLKIHVARPQSRKLHAPQAGRVQRFHHGAIANRWKVGRACTVDDALHLGDAWNASWQAPGQLRQDQFPRRIEIEPMVANQPLAESLERIQPRGLRGALQQFPIRLAMSGQVRLVGFEQVPGDRDRRIDSPFMAPSDEMIQRRAPRVRRLRGEPDGNGPLNERVLERVERIVLRRIFLRRPRRRDSLLPQHGWLPWWN